MRISSLFAVLLVFVLAGCSADDGINRGGTLTGRVTIDGKPVSAGEITLYGEDGVHSVAGKLRNDGTYRVVEPPLGKCKITIITSTFKDIPPKGKVKGPVDYTDSETGEWPIYVPTPAKYEDRDESGLTVVVEKGDQTHDIQLTSKP